MGRRGVTRARMADQTVLSRTGPPTGGPGEIDPYFTGSNILTDPGFENFVDNSGGWYYPDRPDGVDTYVLPRLDVTCANFLRWPSGACAPKTFISWVQLGGSYIVDDLERDTAWKVTTDNPQAGDYNLVWWEWDASGFPPVEVCAFSPFIGAPFSARVNPGDTVTWSIYAEVAKTTGTPQIFPFMQFFNASFNPIRVDNGSVSNLTTSYAQYSMNATAPAGAHYVRSSFGFSQGSGNEVWVSLDTASLGVQP